ncbi:EKC/KEOPS complex subunit TP53RK-like [Daphnia carinata]|uniref:EKC/KEOPS complex subunit TP53RK-like n=1 Tax=Daphnia carinata TaxID=120202 RepID=UPI00257DA36B|nr:EKC/KEOPS complex subunit TP53RK-like [Daphnia carinata]
MDMKEQPYVLVKQGSEAKIYSGSFHGKPCIVKERFPKRYRHPHLDREISTQRVKNEVRSLVRCRLAGVHAPTVYCVNMELNHIMMEHIVDGVTVKDYIKDPTSKSNLDQLASTIGTTIGLLHSQNIIHGDLTTSNMLIRSGDISKLTMIDFGLSFIDHSAEDKGVDLYVLERAMLSTHPNSEPLFEIILKSYLMSNKKDGKETLKKLDEIRLRGRKRSMAG